MRVLGMTFSGHGSSMALVDDGRIVGATNLERLTRTKFSLAALPEHRVALAAAMMKLFDYEEPPPIASFYDVFPLLLESVAGTSNLEEAKIDLAVMTPENIKPNVQPDPTAYDRFLDFFDGIETYFELEHHLCHAYQAYLSSPFDDAAILTIDGRGESLERLGGRAISTTLADGRNRRVDVLTEVEFPSSVGGLYSSVTQHLGFRREQEGNTMALAAFGTDSWYKDVGHELVELRDDGGFTMRETDGQLAYRGAMAELCQPRHRDEPFTQQHYDLAWACQEIAENVMKHAATAVHESTGRTQLAVAGGVSLNCVANTKILTETPITELYVMPNAGDRGLAVGSALYGYHVIRDGEHRHPLAHDYLGRAATDPEIEKALIDDENTEFRRSDNISGECAELVANGQIIGWVQGGAEFGPRALGHRSIVADPRSAESKRRLDDDIKRREWFRPYAPSVLAEHADEYFEMPGPSPFMLLAVNTRDSVREDVAGIVHVDGSARVQTVEAHIAPRYHSLISAFHDLTGIPMVMNTSFNGNGEPIVETPADAIRALHSMGLDYLAIGDYLAWKRAD